MAFVARWLMDGYLEGLVNKYTYYILPGYICIYTGKI